MTQSQKAHQATFSRRGLLSAVSAVSVLSLSQWPGRALAASFDSDAFLALSQKLLGHDDLSKAIATEMFDALSATVGTDRVSALAAGESDSDLANTVVASWYTGESPNPEDLQVLTYTDAEIWEALDYTKPMGYCGGGMGYWADPPET